MRIAGDIDRAEIAAGGALSQYRSDRLPAGRVRLGMRDGGDDLQHLIPAADDRTVEFEMAALAQRHREGHPAELAADVQHMEIAARPVRDGDDIVMHRRRAFARILQQMVARRFSGRDVDPRRRGRGPDRSDSVKIAITPFLLATRGQGERVHTINPFGLSLSKPSPSLEEK